MFRKIIGWFFIILGGFINLALLIILVFTYKEGGTEMVSIAFVTYMFTFIPVMGLFYYIGFKLKDK